MPRTEEWQAFDCVVTFEEYPAAAAVVDVVDRPLSSVEEFASFLGVQPSSGLTAATAVLHAAGQSEPGAQQWAGFH